ncbi:MAG: glycerol-3-phosphate 1-O-acyltransferase PlsY [Pseudomonadota bacterium]
MFIVTIFFMAIGYALGSLSSAVIVAKIMNLPDPRKEGSKNPGATNILRIGGKAAAGLVLLGDILKGFIPVLLASVVGLTGGSLAWVMLAAVVGHMFPCFFQFKGGKGIATMFGGVLGISLLLCIFALIVWIVVAAITRFSSFASLCATAAIVVFGTFLTGMSGLFFPFIIMAILIVIRHQENIKRLMNGTESKIDFKKFS